MEIEDDKQLRGVRRLSNALGLKSKRKLSISNDDDKRPSACPDFIKKYIIKQGYMVKAPPIDKKNRMARWHMRWFVLYDTIDKENEDFVDERKIMLYYFATHNHYISNEPPKGAINLKEADIYPMTHCLHGYPFAIKVCKDTRTYYLCATQRRTRDDWLESLKQHHIPRRVIDDEDVANDVENELENSPNIDPVFTAPTKYLLNSWSTENINKLSNNTRAYTLASPVYFSAVKQGKKKGSNKFISKKNKRDSWIASLSYSMQYEPDEVLGDELFEENYLVEKPKALKLKPTYSLFPASLFEGEDLALEEDTTSLPTSRHNSIGKEMNKPMKTTNRSNSTEEKITKNENNLFEDEDIMKSLSISSNKKTKSKSKKLAESLKRFLNEKKERNKQTAKVITTNQTEIIHEESDEIFSQLSEEDLNNIVLELTNPQNGRRFSSISQNDQMMKQISSLSDDQVSKIIQELMEPQKTSAYKLYRDNKVDCNEKDDIEIDEEDVFEQNNNERDTNESSTKSDTEEDERDSCIDGGDENCYERNVLDKSGYIDTIDKTHIAASLSNNSEKEEDYIDPNTSYRNVDIPDNSLPEKQNYSNVQNPGPLTNENSHEKVVNTSNEKFEEVIQNKRKSKFIMEEEYEEAVTKNKNIGDKTDDDDNGHDESRNSMMFLNSQMSEILERSIKTVDHSWDMGGWCAYQGPKFTIRRKKSK